MKAIEEIKMGDLLFSGLKNGKCFSIIIDFM